jgi:hypothetical protein
LAVMALIIIKTNHPGYPLLSRIRSNTHSKAGIDGHVLIPNRKAHQTSTLTSKNSMTLAQTKSVIKALSVRTGWQQRREPAVGLTSRKLLALRISTPLTC